MIKPCSICKPNEECTHYLAKKKTCSCKQKTACEHYNLTTTRPDLCKEWHPEKKWVINAGHGNAWV